MSSVNENTCAEQGRSIPDGWLETTLGEVINIIGGGTPKTKIPEYWDGEIPWLSVVDFNNDNRWVSTTEKSITELGLKKSSTKLLNVGDIIISARGTVGAMAQLKREMAFNQSCYGIKEVEDVSDKDFLFYLTKHSLKQINRNTYGAVFDTITTKTFDVINVNLPSLPEQKAISNILTAFDDKIENLQAQNKTLEQTAQTIFKERFKNESEDWERVKINELVEISSSKRIFHSEYVDDGIPFYRGKEIIELSTKPDISTELFITEERYNEIKEKHLVPTKGDILLTAVGTLGVPFQVRNYKPFYFKDGNLIWFKNFSNKMSSDFLYNWLKLKTTQNQLNTISIGSTQKALTITSIKELEIPLILDKEKREIFDKVLSSNLNKVNHNLAQIQTLKQTRDTLLPKLMSGQLRVNEFKA